MELCSEIAVARKEAGLSQKVLASRLRTNREKIARLETGTGSVELLVRVMAEIPMRLVGIGKGRTIVEQLKGSRMRRGWDASQLAQATGLDRRTVEAVEAGRGTVASLNSILAALAPRASRQGPTRVFWDYDRAKTASADSRFTPQPFVDALVEVFGPISLDPCAHALSPVKADRRIILPECGLTTSWAGSRFVYANPPFSELARWLKKANDEWENGSAAKIAMLMPTSRFDNAEFHDRAARVATTLILHDRMRFGTPGEATAKYQAPFALALVLWGCAREEIKSFIAKWPALILLPQSPRA